MKIIAAPFVLALILIVATLSFLSCIAGAVCWLACTVFAMLVLAFLVSPFGLPAIGGCLVERLHGVKYTLMDFMTS